VSNSAHAVQRFYSFHKSSTTGFLRKGTDKKRNSFEAYLRFFTLGELASDSARYRFQSFSRLLSRGRVLVNTCTFTSLNLSLRSPELISLSHPSDWRYYPQSHPESYCIRVRLGHVNDPSLFPPAIALGIDGGEA